MRAIVATTLTLALAALVTSANTIVDDSTFSTANWFYACANDNVTLTGGDTLVFDAGTTNVTTAEDDPFVYRPFANTAVEIGNWVVVEMDLTLNNNAPSFHRALQVGFYAMNVGSNIVGNHTNTSVWPRKSSNLALFIGTGGSLDGWSLGAGRHSGSNLANKHPLRNFYGDTYSTGNQFGGVPSVPKNESTSIRLMATRTSSTTMVVSATIGGTNADFGGLGTCINPDWQETTWDDIDGIALGVFSNNGVNEHCGWTLDNVKVSVIPEPAGFGLLVVALLGLARRR